MGSGSRFAELFGDGNGLQAFLVLAEPDVGPRQGGPGLPKARHECRQHLGIPHGLRRILVGKDTELPAQLTRAGPRTVVKRVAVEHDLGLRVGLVPQRLALLHVGCRVADLEQALEQPQVVHGVDGRCGDGLTVQVESLR